MGFLGFLLMFAGVACMVPAVIWMIIEVIKSGLIWALIYFFAPFGNIIWLVKHWEQGSRPFALSIVGAVLFIPGMLMTGDIGSDEPPRTAQSDYQDKRDALLADGELPTKKAPTEEPEDEDTEEAAGASNEPSETATASAPDEDTGTVASAPPPAAAAPAAAAGATSTTEEKLAVANANLDAAAGMLNRMGGARNGNAAPGGQSLAGLAGNRSAPYLDDVPVDTIWTQYYTAVSHVLAGDPRGIREFEICLCAEDTAWLRQNMPAMAELIAPGLMGTNPQEAQLTVLQTLLRNMPTAPLKGTPEVTRSRSLKGVAVARLATDGPGGPQLYTTILRQEGGRWVLVQPFFARTFIWMPQLAQFKRENGMALNVEEQEFLKGGFAPFQQRIQTLYTAVGYRGQ